MTHGFGVLESGIGVALLLLGAALLAGWKGGMKDSAWWFTPRLIGGAVAAFAVSEILGGIGGSSPSVRLLRLAAMAMGILLGLIWLTRTVRHRPHDDPWESGTPTRPRR